jgi:hypothetical protein
MPYFSFSKNQQLPVKEFAKYNGRCTENYNFVVLFFKKYKVLSGNKD